MPGIYIHIPYCRKACYYCNFHFSVSQKNKLAFLSALKQEIALSKNFFNKDKEPFEPVYLDTIYFGGGTPSLLSIEEIMDILNEISRYYIYDKNTEITLEANPDDLSQTKADALYNSPVNRLSIGIQSFHNDDLEYMNRSHNKYQAERSIVNSKNAGFNNITVDLIYGTPGLTDKKWEENIKILLKHEIPHISAYALTVEPNTPLSVLIRKGKAASVIDDNCIRQFEILQEQLQNNNYHHYEISNFGKEGYFSKHNVSYWTGEKYLGLGPSAHSFDSEKRYWNISNTTKYIESIKNGLIPQEAEILTNTQKINEYLMTSLRTMWGCDLKKITADFGKDVHNKTLNSSEKFIQKGWMINKNYHLILTNKGKLFADGIASELFLEQ